VTRKKSRNGAPPEEGKGAGRKGGQPRPPESAPPSPEKSLETSKPRPAKSGPARASEKAESQPPLKPKTKSLLRAGRPLPPVTGKGPSRIDRLSKEGSLFDENPYLYADTYFEEDHNADPCLDEGLFGGPYLEKIPEGEEAGERSLDRPSFLNLSENGEVVDLFAGGVLKALDDEIENALDQVCPYYKLEAGLYLLPTPLGNLGDLSARAVEILSGAEVVVAEDTRRTVKILNRLEIKTKMISYREQNHDRAWPRIRAALKRESGVVLVSDAGSPAISDPGAKLIAAARREGFNIVAIPGPSAITTALMASGMPASSFTFAGFLPPKSSKRKARLSELNHLEHPLVFFESPIRLADSLADMLEVLGDRPALMAREMTKLHEEMALADLSSILESVQSRPRKGEITLVVAGAAGAEGAKEKSDNPSPESLAEGIKADARPTRTVAAELSKTLGRSRKEMYDLVVSIRSGEKDAED
jgi:16S rRNA (cytidine1402-2'-O)-methyltransferase